MNPRVTIGMFIVLVILGGIVYYTETTGAPAAETSDQPRVFDFASSDVEAIAVEASGRMVEVVEQDGSWHVTQPVEDRAESSRVSDVVSRLANLRASREFAMPDASLGEFGLVTPSATVRVRLTGGTTVEFILGGRTPDGTGYYLKRADRPSIYVVNSLIADDLRGWVDRPPRALPTNTPAPTVEPLPTDTPAASPTP